MAWFPKPSGGSAVRNPWCPMENDKLAIGLAMDEGTGTSLANLGTRTDAPWNAIATVNTPTWATESGIGDCLVFAAASSQRVDLATASGSNLSFPRWTLAFFLKPESVNATTRHWIGSGSSSGTGGQIRIVRNGSTNVLTASHYTNASAPTWAFSGVTASAKYLVIATGGERGFSVRLFGESGEIAGTPSNNPSADTSPLVITDGQTFSLMSNGGVGAAATYEFGRGFGFGWWDWQLSTRMIEQIAADPAIWSRPIPSALTPLNNAMVGRVTEDSAYIGGVVSSPSLSGDLYLRVLIASSLDTMISAPDAAFTVSTSSPSATLGDLISDLGGAHYWMALISSDDVTYTPLPGGMGRFQVKREAGTPYQWAFCTDSRFNVDVDNGQSDGYFTDATWPNNKFSYMIWDIFETTPDFVVFGGNEWGNAVESLLTDFEAWVKWRNYINPITQTCCCFAVLGHYDREAGYYSHLSSSDTLGNQADAQALRALFWVNPDDATYPEGGSETGNYFGFTWGDLFLLIGDILTYSSVGVGLSTSALTSPPYVFGETQKNYLLSAAQAATAKSKGFILHQSPGGIRSSSSGERFFGRGTFAEWSKGRLSAGGINFTAHERTLLGSLSPGLGMPEQDWMHNTLLRSNGFNFCLRGKDNQFIHVRKQTVNYITGATGQALYQYGDTTDGKDFKGDFNVKFATRYADGVVEGLTGYGYERFFVAPDGVSRVHRRTFIGIRAAANTKDEIGPHIRDIGPLMTGTNGAITLPETPRMVHCVVAEADGVWTASTQANIETDFAGTNRYTEPHTGDGASDFDEPYANGSIVYDDTGLAEGSQSIYVEYAPRSIGLNGTTTPIPLNKASKTRPRRALMGVGR